MTIIEDLVKNNKGLVSLFVGVGLFAVVTNVADRVKYTPEERQYRAAVASCASYNAMQELFKGPRIIAESGWFRHKEGDSQVVGMMKTAAVNAVAPFYIVMANRVEYNRAYEKCAAGMSGKSFADAPHL